jgi:hypothetical protein
MYILEIIT